MLNNQYNSFSKFNNAGQLCIFNRLPHFTAEIPLNFIKKCEIRLDAIFVPTIKEQSVFISLLDLYSEAAQHVWAMPTQNAISVFRNGTLFPSNVNLVPPSRIEAEHRTLLQRDSSCNPSKEIADDYDIPSKRNLALKISRENGYETILLLDDDIDVDSDVIFSMPQFRNSTAAIGGCCIHDYPDVSTIEHIERYTTGYQSTTMPGGNCMVLNINKISGFFPYLYNDDWFFSVWNTRHIPGLYIGNANQTPHSPWQSLPRVRFEEFGETLISGVLWKQDDELQGDLFNEDFWADLLESRRNYLKTLLSATLHTQFYQAILAALIENNKYTPKRCCRTWKCLYSELEGGLQ